MMKPRTISQFVAAFLLFLAIPAFFFSIISQNQDGFQVSRRVLYQAKTARISLSSDEAGQYVFVLGLEGTGHHMMQSLWERCDGCVPVGGEFNRLYYWHSAKGKKRIHRGDLRRHRPQGEPERLPPAGQGDARSEPAAAGEAAGAEHLGEHGVGGGAELPELQGPPPVHHAPARAAAGGRRPGRRHEGALHRAGAQREGDDHLHNCQAQL
mmetsp:Transcript_819/g.1449  ORF Transcript_819/g.1449 Transcript_819/m.1449 type:complete len:210 (+) Transcript_819:82-711(+)